MTLFKAIATVSGLTLVSRIAGFARDILTASILGAGPIADAFFVALRLPNFFRRIFAEGAFSASFVPLYSEKSETEGRPVAVDFAEQAQALLATALLVLAGVAILFMPYVIAGFAPGFMRDAERYGLAVELSRLTFTYLPLISLVALMGGLLNAENKFAPFAAAPIFFNACLISTLLFAAPYVATPGHALAYGVVAAGIVQVLWMLWNLARNGIVLRPRLPRLSPDMRGMLKLMAPGALTASVMQINLFVDVLLASLLPIGAVSYLYYADRLYQLPLGIIGAAVGTALLPVLSRQIAAAKDKGADQGEALETQGTALEIGLLVSLPATFLMAVMPAPMIAVLFERGAFGPEETAATALALAAYAIGIPAHIMTRVFNSSHFARKDTVGPAKIAMLCTLTNVALSLALIGPYAHAGIALATTLAFWLNAILLFINLYRKGQFVLPGDRVRRLVSQLLAAAACVGAAAWIHAALQPIWPGTDTLSRAIVLTIAFAGGAAAFIAIGTATGCLNRTAIQRLTGRSA